MNIEAEIHRRAIEGWDEPIASAGKRLGVMRKYSDVLLIFYAKKRMPEYREKQSMELTGKDGEALVIKTQWSGTLLERAEDESNG